MTILLTGGVSNIDSGYIGNKEIIPTQNFLPPQVGSWLDSSGYMSISTFVSHLLTS